MTEEVKVVDPNLRKPDLYAAAKENDINRVLELLDEGVTPSYVEEKIGWTALHWAVKHQNVKMVKYLLEFGASESYHYQVIRREKFELRKLAAQQSTADEEDDKIYETPANEVLKNTPLLWAAFKGNLRIVWLLLENGYSPNDVDSLGNNAVHLAAAAGHKKVLQVLIDDGGNANAVNTYKNQPINTSTIPEIRELLEVAMEKGASMTKADIAAKHQHNLKMYTRMVSDLRTAIADANKIDSPRTLRSSNIPQVVSSLSRAIEDARERDLDEEMLAEGDRLLLKLEVSQDLLTDIGNLQKELPIHSQTQYVSAVHVLEHTIERASMVGVDDSQIQLANDLIAQAHIEYWLSVRMERLKDVVRAVDANEHDMTCLRNTIEKASTHRASAVLLEQATALLRRLDCELEIHRALETSPSYRLPPPEPSEGYWQPDDIGHIVEHEGFPTLPPDMTEYVWEHSKAYSAVAACIERLRNCTVAIDSATNPTAIAEAKEKLVRLEKDMKILEAKDNGDKQTAIDAAIKAAKKLKKGKKKGPPKKK
eukprot:gene2322-4515_t